MADNTMTIKEASLKSLAAMKRPATYKEIYSHIIENGLYDFGSAKTPAQIVSAMLGDFKRDGDTRIKRQGSRAEGFMYYLTKHENEIELDVVPAPISKIEPNKTEKNLNERDLHMLLSTYLQNETIFAKTIFHEKSKNSADNSQKWVQLDIVGIRFLKLQNQYSQTLLKAVNRADIFKLSSYELKKEINNDYDLKKYFFQAVSNSSWANYGYLVAFDINSSLYDEIERLNKSFGIGVIELNANLLLVQARLNKSASR